MTAHTESTLTGQPRLTNAQIALAKDIFEVLEKPWTCPADVFGACIKIWSLVAQAYTVMLQQCETIAISVHTDIKADEIQADETATRRNAGDAPGESGPRGAARRGTRARTPSIECGGIDDEKLQALDLWIRDQRQKIPEA